jgi:hypothetical protein
VWSCRRCSAGSHLSALAHRTGHRRPPARRRPGGTYTYRKRPWPKPGETFRWLWRRRAEPAEVEPPRGPLPAPAPAHGPHRALHQDDQRPPPGRSTCSRAGTAGPRSTARSSEGRRRPVHYGRQPLPLGDRRCATFHWSAHGFIFPDRRRGLGPDAARGPGDRARAGSRPATPATWTSARPRNFVPDPLPARGARLAAERSASRDRQFLWAMPDITRRHAGRGPTPCCDWHGAQQKGKAACRGPRSRYSWAVGGSGGFVQVAADCGYKRGVREREIPPSRWRLACAGHRPLSIAHVTAATARRRGSCEGSRSGEKPSSSSSRRRPLRHRLRLRSESDRHHAHLRRRRRLCGPPTTR